MEMGMEMANDSQRRRIEQDRNCLETMQTNQRKVYHMIDLYLLSGYLIFNN